MIVHRSMRFVIVVSSILILSSCTQDTGTQQKTVIDDPDTAEVQTKTQRYFDEDGRGATEEQQSTGFGENTGNQTTRTEHSLDIDKRQTELQGQFSTADQNSDGYLDLHELPLRNIAFVGWPQNYQAYSYMEFTDFRRTARLEDRQRALELSGNDPEQLSNIRNELRRRFDTEFDTADSNDDGRLSREEYHNRNRRMEDQAKRQYFSRLDTNVDGFVDWGEFSIELERWKNLDENRDGLVSRDEQRAH